MLRLAFLWHHHQPCYCDPVSKRAALPWVRLHATKDYYGMARLVSEFTKIKATFNFVPSLLVQLKEFAEFGAKDAWLEVMEPEVARLGTEERRRAVDLGFHANPRTMIAAFPRYEELHRKKLSGARFSSQDLLDLQTLSALAWFHKTLLDEDPLLRTLREKGRGFSEDDKRALFAKSREVAASVIPLHRRLEDEGRIEITTSPFYHPILPLLCDFRSAFEAMPWLAGNLGFEPVSLREDAAEQVRRAIVLHEQIFGRRPRGMWPSEGSVSQDIIPIAVGNGILYIATDEEILACSLGRPLRRDGDGNMLDGQLLYRPWRVRAGNAELTVVFRDHRISDLFGFDYHRDPAAAVDDFLRRLAWIRDRIPLEDPLVPIILDGENAWEHYPDGAVPFFRALYRALEGCDWIETVRLGDEVARRPPGELLPRLFPGSWIDHNFAIWIGHEEDRRAWRLLLEARAALLEAEKGGALGARERDLAWNEIYIAEGSDWYWWYGDDRTSGMDDVFDRLFREHIRNVYRTIGRPPPPELESPIAARHEPPVQPATAFLDVRIDGRRTSFFEWLHAGRFRAESEFGAMERGQAGLVEEIAFGFDSDRLFVAVDFGPNPQRVFADGGSVRVHFVKPKDEELTIYGPGRMALGSATLTSVAIDEILELAVPWKEIGAKAGDEVRFFVAVARPGGGFERVPRSFAIRVDVPDETFESRVWAV